MDVLITDMHFGVRNNSMTWFNSQMEFFNKQFIPFLKEHKPDRVICLGDVFDVRSTVSNLIAHEVRKLFEQICLICPTIIIAGNHDFYSPNEDTYCTLENVLFSIPGCSLIVHEIIETENEVFVPWFECEKYGIEELTKRFKKPIFTHTDLIISKPKLHGKVYSGHIHGPYCSGNLCNLGSVFPLTFSDNNAARYFYTLEDGVLTPIKNEHSIRFWRFKNDEILDDPRWDHVKLIDYIELYINANRLAENEIQDRIASLSRTYRNIWTIPQQVSVDNEPIDIQCDIHDIVESMIPDELREKFELIKSKMQQD